MSTIEERNMKTQTQARVVLNKPAVQLFNELKENYISSRKKDDSKKIDFSSVVFERMIEKKNKGAKLSKILSDDAYFVSIWTDKSLYKKVRNAYKQRTTCTNETIDISKDFMATLEEIANEGFENVSND